MKFQQPAQTFENLDKPRISFSGFDLSHRHTTTFDMGQVIPIAVIECIPNDRFDLGASGVLRMQPLVAPVLHPIKLKVQAWFVPYRLLMSNSPGSSWADFITGGDQGTTVIALPTMNPTDMPLGSCDVGSLWDRFGMNPVYANNDTVGVAEDCRPLTFPWLAYTKIWNDWYRIPGLQNERSLASLFYQPAYENWPRDYFTSALPFLQRGVSPSLPVLGTINATAAFDTTVVDAAVIDALGLSIGSPGDFGMLTGHTVGKAQLDTALTNAADVTVTSTLSTVDTKQIRLAFLYQAFLERMARGGARYAEMLPNIWGARPLDQRLQRVEYIGGFDTPWITSEVLQTSASDTQPTPQGNMAGHGIAIPSGNLGRYRVDEHGLIMITACAYPDAMYQQGIPRAWLRRTREEFPSPSFAGLSEQEIFNAEIFNQTTDADPDGTIGRTPFGYTGRYNEMRYHPSIVSSEMREILDYWHLGRQFDSLPGLNNAFLSMEESDTADNFKRIFAVSNVPGILATFGLKVHVKRPIPFMAVPAQLGGG